MLIMHQVNTDYFEFIDDETAGSRGDMQRILHVKAPRHSLHVNCVE